MCARKMIPLIILICMESLEFKREYFCWFSFQTTVLSIHQRLLVVPVQCRCLFPPTKCWRVHVEKAVRPPWEPKTHVQNVSFSGQLALDKIILVTVKEGENYIYCTNLRSMIQECFAFSLTPLLFFGINSDNSNLMTMIQHPNFRKKIGKKKKERSCKWVGGL